MRLRSAAMPAPACSSSATSSSAWACKRDAEEEVADDDGAEDEDDEEEEECYYDEDGEEGGAATDDAACPLDRVSRLEVRRTLSSVRAMWDRHAPATPFCLATPVLGASLTAGEFCVHFLLSQRTRRSTPAAPASGAR